MVQRGLRVLDERWVRVGPWSVRVLQSRHAEQRPLPVLFLSGFVVGGHSAPPMAVELARRYGVYVPDPPGYGKSTRPPRMLKLHEQADILAGLLDALGLRRVAVLGNSFSAQMAAELAYRHPERVHRLVLVAPAGDPHARNALHQLFRLIRNSFREDAVLTGMVGDYVDMGVRRIWANARLSLGDRMEEKLPRIPVPTLVVCAERDAVSPRRWAEEAARMLPRGRLVVVPGYAHGLDRLGAPVLAEVIAPFLDEAAVEAGAPEVRESRQEKAVP